MAKVPYVTGRSGATTIAANNTRVIQWSDGDFNILSGADSQVQRPVQQAGKASNLWIRIVTNSVSAASTLTSRIAAADGAQTVSITANTTGEFEDTAHTDALAVNDQVNTRIVIGATGTSIGIAAVSMVFAPTDGSTLLPYVISNMNELAASETKYYMVSGGSSSTTEGASLQLKLRAAGTVRNMVSNVTVNGRSTDTTYGTRINSAPGNVTYAVTALTTGQFSDLTHTDTVVSGDLIGTFTTSGTGTGTTAAFVTQLECISANQSVTYASGATAATGVYNAGTTKYQLTQGKVDSSTTESDQQTKSFISGTASLYEIYISANTISGAGTIKFRKNGANGNGSISITASTTGWFEDTTHTDVVVPTDEIGWQINAGSGGTSMAIAMMAVQLQVQPDTHMLCALGAGS